MNETPNADNGRHRYSSYVNDAEFRERVDVGAEALLAENPPDLDWDGARMVALVVLSAVEGR